MKTHKQMIKAGMAFSLLFSSAAVFAQDGTEDVIVLDEVAADDVPIEESILATSRPISSVYGSDRSVLDTPRNVNIISREQLDAISIKDVRDFSKLTSSSYTKTNFGAPTSPNLRGQEGDLFINGIRRGHSTNGNGVPINFNSVESVNIVKGPAGAVYGSSNYVGGYADLQTKRAYFEHGGSAKVSYGSYDQITYDLDVNVPISDTMAARFSIQTKEWDGFWDDWYLDSEAYYATFAWKPNDRYRLDVMGEYFVGEYTENWGINRVTQDLIDHGLYIPNRPDNDNGTGPQSYADYADGAGGFNNTVPVDVDNPIPVQRTWKLSAPEDDSKAVVFWAQALQELKVSDDFKVLNNTYFHYKDRQTFSSYHYSELMRDNWSLDNRLQVIQDFFPSSTFDKITLNYGARFRYQEIWSVNDFNNEPVNYFDLSKPKDNNRVEDPAFAGSYYIRDQEPRGSLSRWYSNVTSGNAEAQDTQTFIVGPFLQTDIKLSDRLSFLAGYTIDYVNTMEGYPDTLVDNAGNPLNYEKTNYDGALYNANISVVFKPTEKTATYLTYNEGKHYTVATGGAVLGDSLDGTRTTKLLEAGFNASLLDEKLYLGMAAFHQEYTTRNQDGSIDPITTDGFEIELNYQPNRNFFATVGYSIVDSKRTKGFFASPYTADRADETGGNYMSPYFDAFSASTGSQEFENPGVPEHLLNALVQYKFDNGFGVQMNALVWGEMNSGYEGYETTVIDFVNGGFYTLEANTARLPIQYEIDAKVFYEYEGWKVTLSAFNITDEENWDVNNSGYGNGSAVARPDTNYEVSVSYTW